MNLNFFPINFDFRKYQINTEPYSDERIKELRQKYNTTHSFFRNEDKIFISNNQEVDNITLGSTETINVYEDSTITSRLIKHVFFRDFKNRFPKYIPTDFYPFRFFSGKDDLICNILPQDLKGKIAYRKLIEIQLRKIEYNDNPLFGFIINIDRNWTFSKNCEELNNEGFSLNQVEVVHTEIFPGLENIIAPNEEFIGIIKEIIALHLFLEKEQVHLFQNKDGFCFTVDSNPLSFDNAIDLKTPVFIFDYAGIQKGATPDKGLTDFGPYDSTTFDIKKPNILGICHKTNRGAFSSFLANLKDGLPISRYFKKGLLGKYELHGASINIQEIQNYAKSDYLGGITQFTKNSNEKPHLAIIEIPANFKRYKERDNPYYEIKAKLLSMEIPVQFVTTENIKGNNENMLNAIALQIYAKLGGTPWVLPTKPSVDREIVVGIGHSWLRNNQYKGAEQNRIVGITTFLSSDGQYILGDKIKDVKYEDYFAELLKSLDESIDLISTEQGWEKGDTVRLIFHIFKPIKNVEFEVISELAKKKSDFKIQFAFITISKSHPFLLFDTNQLGVSDNYNNVKGEFIPNRAQNIVLDNETCIVQMIGAYELKTYRHGMSSPIQIKIRRPQNALQNQELDALLYYDLSYIVQQIYAFTYLSWRGFLPSDEPATMLYSNLISKLLGKMKSVTNWNADNLNYGLKRKKWFL